MTRRAPRHVLSMDMPSAPQPRPDPEIERVRSIARILDNYFVDPIIGMFVPGAGEVP